MTGRTQRSMTAAIGLALALGASAPHANAGEPLLDLLEEVRSARRQEAELDARREAEFAAERERQAELLGAARARRDAADARSRALSSAYDAQERELRALEETLRERAGNLGELFGVTRQVAADAATVFQQSMISAQLRDREGFARGLSGAKELPSIEELEQIWYELLREMTETGRVSRFETPLIDAAGTLATASVTRVGPFTASADGRLLAYLPTQQRLAALPRPLPSRFERAARELEGSTSGIVSGVVDPSRGVLLGLYMERPSVLERIEKGEAIGVVILVVGAIGALVALYQLVFLLRTRFDVSRQLRKLATPSADNPLGRVLLAFRGTSASLEEEAEIAELRISEAVLREVPRLERFQNFLRLVVAAGPLLGLVGTVIGMIVTFQSITESGSSDPRLMANGIGQAMIATVLGLGIAIPILFMNAGLSALSQQIVGVLEEQSTGLLAESLEERSRHDAR